MDRVPDIVQWHEGMLLSPQHLQLLCARYERLLEQSAAGGAFPGWGVRHVEIDMARLLGGEFRLLEAEAVLPDGLQVKVTADQELSVDLTALAEQPRAAVAYVYVAAPAGRSLATTGEMARYRSAEYGPVRDETGESEVIVPVLRPNVQLWAGKALPARLVGIPVAGVRLVEDVYVLDSYQPPTAGLGAGTGLRRECAAVVREVREKAMLLADRMRGMVSSSDAGDLWHLRLQVRSLVAALPGLEALLGLELVHPQALHVKMSELAGQLAPLSHGLVPPVFPSYDHGDPAGSIGPMLRFVSQAMSEGISERWVRLRFQYQDGEFRVLPDAVVDKILGGGGGNGPALVLALRARTGERAGALDSWCEEALIASESVKDGLIEMRALGAGRTAIQQVDGLSVGADQSLYAIEAPSGWLRPGEPIILQGCPGGHWEPQEAVLLARRPNGPAPEGGSRGSGEVSF